MKKGVLCLALMVCLILPGCAQGGKPPKEEKESLRVRQISQSASGYEARLTLRLSYPQKSGPYRLAVSFQKEGKTSVSILEPEYMKGFSVVSEGDKVSFLFDGEPFEDGGGLNTMPVSLLRVLCEIPLIKTGQTGKVEGETVLFEREEKTPLGSGVITLTVDKKSALPLEGTFLASFLKGEITFEQFAYRNEPAADPNATDKKDESK